MAVTSLWHGGCSSRRGAALASLGCPFAGHEPAAPLCSASSGICTKRHMLIQQPLTTGTAAAGTALSTAEKTSTKDVMKATGSSRCCRVKGFLYPCCSLPLRATRLSPPRCSTSAACSQDEAGAQRSPAKRKPGLSKEPRARWDWTGCRAPQGPASQEPRSAFSHQAL